jgi:hypothetical protein
MQGNGRERKTGKGEENEIKGGREKMGKIKKTGEGKQLDKRKLDGERR